MNRIHDWYCKSDRWNDLMVRGVLPEVLEGVALDGSVLEIGPGPGFGEQGAPCLRGSASDECGDRRRSRRPSQGAVRRLSDCSHGRCIRHAYGRESVRHHRPAARCCTMFQRWSFRIRSSARLTGSSSQEERSPDPIRKRIFDFGSSTCSTSTIRWKWMASRTGCWRQDSHTPPLPHSMGGLSSGHPKPHERISHTALSMLAPGRLRT